MCGSVVGAILGLNLVGVTLEKGEWLGLLLRLLEFVRKDE